MRKIRGIDENFNLYTIDYLEGGDWVKCVDAGHFKLTNGKIYEVARDETEGFGVPNKIGIYDDTDNLSYMYALRFEHVQRQGELIV